MWVLTQAYIFLGKFGGTTDFFKSFKHSIIFIMFVFDSMPKYQRCKITQFTLLE